MSSKTDVRSTEEIRRIGIEALAEALGPLDAVRFLQSFDLGRGDYTKERSHVLGLTLDEIFMGIEKRKNTIIEYTPLPKSPIRYGSFINI